MRVTCNATDNSQTVLSWIRGSGGKEFTLPSPFIFDLALDEVDSNAILLSAYFMRPELLRRSILAEPKVSASLVYAMSSALRDGPVLATAPVVPVQDDQVHLYISTRPVEAPKQNRGTVRKVLVEQRSLKNWTGRLFSLDHVIISSNYELACPNDPGGVRASIALGLLMSSDWKSSQITVEDPNDSMNDADRSLARELAAGAGYSLEIVGAEEFERRTQGADT